MRITFDAVPANIYIVGHTVLYSNTSTITVAIMNRLSTLFSVAALSVTLLLTASCHKKDNDTNINPTGTPPAWGLDIHKEMLTVIEQLDSFHVPALQSLTPGTARQQLNIFDAQKEVARLNGLSAPFVSADTFSREIPVTGTTIHACIYKPHSGAGPFPAIVYYHGGGFSLGSVKMYDATSRSLAEQTGAMVFSIEYREGPEAKFPTAHNDAFTAYKYVIENATALSININKLAVCGEGAGANLACNVCIAARDAVIKTPVYQLLIYPITEGTMNTASYTKYAAAEPVSQALASWELKNYLTKMSDTSDTRISLITADLHSLPPTTIINATIDPRSDDGQMLEAALNNAGVSVIRKMYEGVTHDFYGMNIVLPEARDAEGIGANAIRTAFQ